MGTNVACETRRRITGNDNSQERLIACSKNDYPSASKARAIGATGIFQPGGSLRVNGHSENAF